MVFPFWVGSLPVVSSEGIWSPLMALVRLSLLLPYKTMENATAEGND